MGVKTDVCNYKTHSGVLVHERGKTFLQLLSIPWLKVAKEDKYLFRSDFPQQAESSPCHLLSLHKKIII